MTISQEYESKCETLVIDNQLGCRAPQSVYSYSDLFLNLWNVFYCGGDCAEDLNEHLKEYLVPLRKLVIHCKSTVYC